MKSPIQSPPSGRAVIIPATLVAALIAAPMLAFSQTSPSPAPGSATTPPPAAAPASPGMGMAPSGSMMPGAAPSTTMMPGAPAARPSTTTTQAPSTPGTTSTTTTTQVPAQQRTTTTTTATAGQAAMPTNRASRIIGANVLNERNETVGEIEDLIINASGAAPVAVLSVGGFLGIGARLVAVPLSELRFNAERERWVLNGATKESLQARPVYTYQRS